MKTSEELATELSRKYTTAEGEARETIRRLLVLTIEADRAQRNPNDDGTLHGAAIMALEDRAGSHFDNGEFREAGLVQGAARWIEENPDEFWDRFAGPMLDEIEGL